MDLLQKLTNCFMEKLLNYFIAELFYGSIVTIQAFPKGGLRTTIQPINSSTHQLPYLATFTALFSLITVTFICPG